MISDVKLTDGQVEAVEKIVQKQNISLVQTSVSESKGFGDPESDEFIQALLVA